ncbi:hypothetical protein AVEN_138775-1 [Araneus ventricosus]|uniref:Mariner Mos1 transposase n=1 Tax=Araneus ventricosus TaxID=182803 RepID=A0A4Y2FN29_ARAVE|nr:hypothetical protein AVEN_138775-1 [Araneus ventricosus]
MMAASSKIKNIVWMVKHIHLHNSARPFAELRTQQLLQWFRLEVFSHPVYISDLAPSGHHLLQHLKWFLARSISPVMTTQCADRWLSHIGSALSRRISSTPVYRN